MPKAKKMSLWGRSQHFDEVPLLYGDDFPLEVRHYLAPFIENQVTLFTDNEIDIQHARSIFYQLINEIEITADRYRIEWFVALQLRRAIEMLKNRYEDDPLRFIAKLRYCLNKEYQLVHEHKNFAKYKRQLKILNSTTQNAGKDLEYFVSGLKIKLAYKTCINFNLFQGSSIQSVDVPALEEAQHSKSVSFLSSHQLIYKSNIEKIEHIQPIILDKLIKWKNVQRMTENSRLIDDNELNFLYKNCETLAELIMNNKNQIKECEKLWLQLPPTFRNNENLFPSLKIRFMELLKDLVVKSFVIEKQPPQVLKINVNFEATVSLPVGKILTVHSINPQVRVIIIKERQVELMTGNEADIIHAGEMINNKETMKYKPDGKFYASFCELMLKNIQLSEKKEDETDEKFVLLFQTQFLIDEEIPPIPVSILSLPFAVIENVGQEIHPWSKISWEKDLPEHARIPSQVPDQVIWPQVAEILNMKFTSVTGKGLSLEQLEFLASKALRKVKPFDSNQMFLPLSQFCKEHLPDVNFSFFEWFNRAMNITLDYFQQMWIDNLIVGFIDRKDAENMLKEYKSGTFLLKFSNTVKEGVSIMWLQEESNNNDRKYVSMLYPYTPKDLKIRSLANRIADLNFLTHLYPDIPKEKAFRKYYSSESSVTKDYNTHRLVRNDRDISQAEVASLPYINIPCGETSTSLMTSTNDQDDSSIFEEFYDSFADM